MEPRTRQPYGDRRLNIVAVVLKERVLHPWEADFTPKTNSFPSPFDGSGPFRPDGYLTVDFVAYRFGRPIPSMPRSQPRSAPQDLSPLYSLPQPPSARHASCHSPTFPGSTFVFRAIA